MDKKPKKCKVCGSPFNQVNSLVVWCSPECGYKYKTAKAEKKANRPRAIKPISDKQLARLAEYRKVRKEFLSRKENQICPVTGEKTNQVHHRKGKIGDLLCDTRFFLAVSFKGHRDRKSTRLNSSHVSESRMPSSA